MRALLAPDSFKGSLSATDVSRALAGGLTERGVQTSALPTADGGDGSVAAAVAAGFTPRPVTVSGPTGELVATGVAERDGTWVIEVAGTCGLTLLPYGIPQPLRAHSRGLGDALRAVLVHRPERVVLALGGSASTDGGAGLLAALGVPLLDRDDLPVEPGGGSLHRIKTVDLTAAVDLGGVDLVLATDVDNPLLGHRGAAAVYAPQKGADQEQVRILENGLRDWVHTLAENGRPDAADLAREPGAGAAGGIGFAGMLLGGRRVSGAGYFLDLLGFHEHLARCDVVITGEGRLDGQTGSGKLVAEVVRRAGDTPVVAVVGTSTLDPDQAAELGLAAVISLTDLTDGDPANDPNLTATLLTEAAQTLDLPACRPV